MFVLTLVEEEIPSHTSLYYDTGALNRNYYYLYIRNKVVIARANGLRGTQYCKGQTCDHDARHSQINRCLVRNTNEIAPRDKVMNLLWNSAACVTEVGSKNGLELSLHAPVFVLRIRNGARRR